MPTAQYPTRCTSMGVRVSPSPRSAPPVTTWKPSNSVGALRQHEFDVQFDVAEFPLADEVGGAAIEAVQDAVAGSGHGGEPRGPQQAVPDDAGRAEPVAPAGTLAVPAGEVVAVEERHPAFLDEIGRIAVGVAIV